MSDGADIPAAMSTSALQAKLKDLKEKSNKQSQVLTAKLASSQSGQNLLHIGTSLSTLPPDLHSLLTQLHPVLSAAESTEKQYMQRLQNLVDCGNQIRTEQRRVAYAKESSDLYKDLLAAELVVKRDASSRRSNQTAQTTDNSDTESTLGRLAPVDHASSLERCAHTTLCLVQDLQSSTDKVTALTASKVVGNETTSNLPSMRTLLEEDTERAQFLMKLAPRIRRLESDTIMSLSHHMDDTLKQLQRRREGSFVEADQEDQLEDELLLMLGHCMRGLALLGRGKEVENIFARVAIMPLIRSRVSMGRLDEGGARGECTGLPSLLDDIILTIAKAFSPVLQLAEIMFDVGPRMEVDLVTGGIWAPIATALMADAGIKMAIFSPGIASVLQRNYLALDTFLANLAERLLDNKVATGPPSRSGELESLYFRPTMTLQTLQKAQDRIYSHPKTAEFSKRWNLPIYYQLRFGESCTRLNTAIEKTRAGGWIADVYSGDTGTLDSLKNTAGFELTFFLELYDILLGLWRPDVILKPLTNRFLRGAVQLVGRSVAFISDGMSGKLQFGGSISEGGTSQNGEKTNGAPPVPLSTQRTYSWGDSAQDVAAVAWELAILETSLAHDYVKTVSDSLESIDSSEDEKIELRSLVRDVLKEASSQIQPTIVKAWNEVIVSLLTSKCYKPLAAVKGVAATYRMTNRPPPTQASPFVATILRPLKEFDDEFSTRTPDQVGGTWKALIVTSVTDRYSAAVEELITTVQKTEVALQNRRATTRRAASGGISDGDKVKLQLFLDFKQYSEHVRDLGLNPATIPGISKLQTLTAEGGNLQVTNGI